MNFEAINLVLKKGNRKINKWVRKEFIMEKRQNPKSIANIWAPYIGAHPKMQI